MPRPPRPLPHNRRGHVKEDMEELHRIKRQVAELESIMKFAFSRASSSAAQAPSASSRQPSAAASDNGGSGGGGRAGAEFRRRLPPEVEAEVQLPAIMLSRRTVSAAAALGIDDDVRGGGRWQALHPDAGQQGGQGRPQFGLRPGALEDDKALQFAITLDKNNQHLFESAAWRRQQASPSQTVRHLSTAKILWPVLSPIVPGDKAAAANAGSNNHRARSSGGGGGSGAANANAPGATTRRWPRASGGQAPVDNDGGMRPEEDPEDVEAEVDRIIAAQTLAEEDEGPEVAAGAGKLRRNSRAAASAKASRLSAPPPKGGRQGPHRATGNRRLVGRHRKFTVKVQAPIDQQKHVVRGVPLYCYDKHRQWEKLIQPNTPPYEPILAAIQARGINFKLYYKAYVDPATRQLRVLFKHNCSPEPW